MDDGSNEAGESGLAMATRGVGIVLSHDVGEFVWKNSSKVLEIIFEDGIRLSKPELIEVKD